MVSSDEINKRLEAKRRGIKYQEPIGRTTTNSTVEKEAVNPKECPSCHTQNPSTAKFCVGCGMKLEIPPEEKGFTPEIKGPESEIEEKPNKPIQEKHKITPRPDDFGRTNTQEVKPSTISETTTLKPAQTTHESTVKKLEPIIPKSPVIETTSAPETGANKAPEPETTPKPPEPQVKKPETIKPSEPEVKKTITATPEEKPKSDVDPVERIKKAKELLDIGAITQEEFDIIKNKYLDEI